MFKGHPKGLIAAALSNMGERFGYYIMNAVLALFLCSKFGLAEGEAGAIYSVFYAGIYILALVGGFIADKTQNYKGTIMTGLAVMATGYVILSIPVLATPQNSSFLLIVTCLALFLIAFGNGLFKGNLQAIVGQMYDNFEAEAAKEGEEALRIAQNKRDTGFQIFYVFINIGGVVAPFVAPLLREWWLKTNGLVYNSALPAYCHEYIKDAAAMDAGKLANMEKLVTEVGGTWGADMSGFCNNYLEIFNEGVHFSFIASVAAMAISLLIFVLNKRIFPNPAKKEAQTVVGYTAEEKQAMAQEIKQRLTALFAVLIIVIFFWFSFHQNGMSLSFFARDFVDQSLVAPEIWQALNPFFVIVLTPIVIFIFGALTKAGHAISTPRKIAIGMGIAGLAFLFLAIYSYVMGYPSANEFKAMSAADKVISGPWVLIVLYFFLTVAELFISPLGLSFVSKVAPRHMVGLCQGLWLGATALGNLMLWVGPLMYNAWPIWQCWTVFLAVCFVSMGVMFGMVKWLEKVTQ